MGEIRKILFDISLKMLYNNNYACLTGVVLCASKYASIKKIKKIGGEN